MKGWELQLPNLLSNKNVFAWFRNPINLVRIGRVGYYLGLEGLVECGRNRCCVRRDSQFVEPHPLPETRDQRINLDLELSTAQMISQSAPDKQNPPNPSTIPIHTQRGK